MYMPVSVSLGHRSLFIYLAHIHILKDLIMAIILVVLYLNVGVTQFKFFEEDESFSLIWYGTLG